MNNKKNILITVILCILVLIIGLVVGNYSSKYFSLENENLQKENEKLKDNSSNSNQEDIVDDSSKNQNDENINNSYDNSNLVDNNVYSENLKDLVGVYTAKIEFEDNSDDAVRDGDGNSINKASFTLYLFGNGTFKYESTWMVPTGVIGNYIVDENKNVVLNYWFNTSSDVSLYVTKGTKILYVDKDDNLLDNDSKYSQYGVASVKLVKSSDKNLLDYYNIFSVVNTMIAAFCDGTSARCTIENPNI